MIGWKLMTMTVMIVTSNEARKRLYCAKYMTRLRINFEFFFFFFSFSFY